MEDDVDPDKKGDRKEEVKSGSEGGRMKKGRAERNLRI